MEDHSNNKKVSPVKFWQAAAIQAGAGIIGGLMGRKKRRAQQRAAKAEYDKMKRSYEELDTSNIYAGVKNPYAGVQSQFENVYEDLTVNQQQAQFQAQQGAQQRANIMQQMGGAAGGSGVAGLAQAMANQGQQATQRASASIGQQEAANQAKAAAQAGQLQKMERQGGFKADMLRIGGAEKQRAMEQDRTRTLLTMSANQLATTKTAEQQAEEQMWSGVGNMFSLGGQF